MLKSFIPTPLFLYDFSTLKSPTYWTGYNLPSIKQFCNDAQTAPIIFWFSSAIITKLLPRNSRILKKSGFLSIRRDILPSILTEEVKSNKPRLSLLLAIRYSTIVKISIKRKLGNLNIKLKF